MNLKNKTFDEGHHHQGDLRNPGEPFSDCVVPDGWFLWWRDEETIPDTDVKAARPESVVWNSAGAPANEQWMFLSKPYNWKVFKAYRAMNAAANTVVTGLEPGKTYVLTINIIPDIVDHYEGGKKVAPDDPWAGEVRLGSSLADTDWFGTIAWDHWHAPAHSKYPLQYLVWNTLTLEFTATAEEMGVWVEIKAKYGLENNWFMDSFSIREKGVQQTTSKMGPHVLKFNKDSHTPELCKAGPAVIKFVSEWGYRDQVPSRTLVIGRMHDSIDVMSMFINGVAPEDAAERFVNYQLDTYKANNIEYWEGPNELHFDNNLDWYAAFEHARMKIMASHGYKCVIGNFSTGKPDLHHWPLFIQACESAFAYEGILGLHEYSCPWMWWMTGKYQEDPTEDLGDEGWTTLRYRKVYRQFLEPNGLGNLPLVITECGLDPLVRPLPPDCSGGTWKQLDDYWAENQAGEVPYTPDNEEYYFGQLEWYENELKKDDYVVGFTVFTHGSYKGTAWRNFDVANTRVEDKIIAHVKDNPPAPWTYPEKDVPVSPTCRGTPRIQYKRTYVLLPPTAGKGWANAVVDATWDDQRYTVGSSADDAGVADLDDRNVIAVNPEQWGGTIPLEDWYALHYPGVKVVVVRADTPADLARILSGHNGILLGQGDMPWGPQRYGQGRCPTFASMGCWITDCAMAMRYYGIDEFATPLTVDNIVGSEGYTAACEMLWSAMPKLGLKVVKSTTSQEEVIEHLREGGVCFAEVSPASYQHFVMVTRFEAGLYLMYDPLKRVRGWLHQHYLGVDSWRLVTTTDVKRDHPLIGIHDLPGATNWMIPNGLKGWCCMPIYVGTTPKIHDVRDMLDAGIRVIANWRYSYAVDDGGKGTMPGPDELAAFEAAVLTSMRESSGFWGHVYCNEMNNPREWPDGHELTPTYYINSYNRVANSRPPGTRISPGAIDPFNPGWGDWRTTWADAMTAMDSKDFLALHTYDHGRDADPEHIFGDDPLRGVYYNLRVLETQMEYMPNLPIVITETNHLTKDDGTLGWENDQSWIEGAYNYFAKFDRVQGACAYRYDYDEWALKNKDKVLAALASME